MAIGNKLVDKLDLAIKTADTVKKVGTITKKNSIMRMAAPGMYQYQYLGSDAIETDVHLAITQALQMTFASNVCTAYSLNPLMSLKDYNNISDFVQSFHKNTAMPTNVKGAANTLGVSLAKESATTLEGANVEDAEVISVSLDRDFKPGSLEGLAMEAWSFVEDSLDTATLNDMYRPYDRTARIKKEKLADLQSANEGLSDTIDKLHNTVNDVNKTVRSKNGDTNEGIRSGAYKTVKTDKDGNPEKDKDGKVKMETHYTYQPRNFKNEIVRVQKLEAMEPTMVNVQVLCHGDKKGSMQFTQNVSLGVKVMPRIISSNVMIAAMAECCRNTHHILSRLLRWTKGEEKTLDFIFGWTAAKKKAIKENAKMEERWIGMSKRRKKAGPLGKITKEGIFPILTIVITTYEAEKIRELTSMDLTNYATALKLMNEYYLLAFGIYDNAQNTLKMLFDGDSDWSFTSIGAMKSIMSKTTDLLNQKQILTMMGRR